MTFFKPLDPDPEDRLNPDPDQKLRVLNMKYKFCSSWSELFNGSGFSRQALDFWTMWILTKKKSPIRIRKKPWYKTCFFPEFQSGLAKNRDAIRKILIHEKKRPKTLSTSRKKCYFIFCRSSQHCPFVRFLQSLFKNIIIL